MSPIGLHNNLPGETITSELGSVYSGRHLIEQNLILPLIARVNLKLTDTKISMRFIRIYVKYRHNSIKFVKNTWFNFFFNNIL